MKVGFGYLAARTEIGTAVSVHFAPRSGEEHVDSLLINASMRLMLQTRRCSNLGYCSQGLALAAWPLVRRSATVSTPIVISDGPL